MYGSPASSRPRSIGRLIHASALLSALAATAAAAAPRRGQEIGAEVAFQEARAYTVRIRTRVETPFLEDDQGSGTGAGFLVDARRGWILTNAHVVSHSPSAVEVAFADEPFRPVRKVYVDSFDDIAILALETPDPGRPAAVLDERDAPSVGEPIGAYGHPLDMPFTGTRGIVSGLPDPWGEGLLQIDATVDPGNSGGPVIALRSGRVVGIATAMVERDKSDRLNFATPIREARRILALIRSGSSACPPRLPIALMKNEEDRYTMEVARSFDPAGWPLRAGDRIVGVADAPGPMAKLADLVRALRGRTGEVALTVERAGRRESVTVRAVPRDAVLERRGVVLDGALVAPLEFEDEPRHDRVGLTVHSVESGSAAEALGLERGDGLYTLDGRRFGEVDSLISYLERRPAGPTTVVIRRWSGQIHHMHEYHSRELPGENVTRVGPDGALPLATKD